MCWAKESDWDEMPKPPTLFAQLHTFTTNHMNTFWEKLNLLNQELFCSFSCPTWAPPAHTFSTYRHLLLFVFLGKTTHGFSATASLAVLPYACWALCSCLERAAEEGSCAPLEVGSFAAICKQDSRIEADYFFCCFALTIFCLLCFALIKQQMPLQVAEQSDLDLFLQYYQRQQNVPSI